MWHCLLSLLNITAAMIYNKHNRFVMLWPFVTNIPLVLYKLYTKCGCWNDIYCYVSWSVFARQVGPMASESLPPPPPPHLGHLSQVGYRNQPGPNLLGKVSSAFMFITYCNPYTYKYLEGWLVSYVKGCTQNCMMYCGLVCLIFSFLSGKRVGCAYGRSIFNWMLQCWHILLIKLHSANLIDCTVTANSQTWCLGQPNPA